MNYIEELPMKPEEKSQRLLSIARSQAKMFEYDVPIEHHIKIPRDPAALFSLCVGMIGDLAAAVNQPMPEPGSASELFVAEHIEELRKELKFSAYFFDSYHQSKLNQTLYPTLDLYLQLMGAASYYLCDLPGNAVVLAKQIGGKRLDLGGDGLENLLLWLLQGDVEEALRENHGLMGGFINGISNGLAEFFQSGDGEESLPILAKELREFVYEYGTPRQLLLGDVIGAVLIKKLQNSSWNALPRYSGISQEQWRPALQKPTFIKELWQAQHLLGDKGVLEGKSAIVQMPTSAGKTKATELVVRSAFLSGRASLAIIVAPFRALCAEINDSLIAAFQGERIIVNELTDVTEFDISQLDFNNLETLEKPQVMVVTPEKLVYVLRHSPEVAERIGLLVFDEGHQFDSGSRGITYELLLTSLRSMIAKETQKVLISAVIRNAEEIGEWLNGTPNVVKGAGLSPTFRSVGFASWRTKLGEINYVDIHDPEKHEFFVPRVIERFELEKKGRETKDRFFPEKSGADIAFYLGLKLVGKGGVAVFCGRKDSVTQLCERVVDIIDRSSLFTLPPTPSNSQEITHLTHLYVENLGAIAPASECARLGIFSHHGNTPHGIRLAVEYAMRKDYIHFVFCTSTLAQGVNLPIKYLIVRDVRQGNVPIKTRDFQNLMGRAGRAGMHTEGSVLFANPKIYDGQGFEYEEWRWDDAKKLLRLDNSEPSISSLLSIFDSIKSDDNTKDSPIDVLGFATAYLNNSNEGAGWAIEIAKQAGVEKFSQKEIKKQLDWKINLICKVESFLLSHFDEVEGGLLEADAIRLAKKTLAYFLVRNEKEKREDILALFKLLAENIATKIPNSHERKIYGRTLGGVHHAQAIDEWAQSNLTNLISAIDEANTLDLVWPLFAMQITNGIFVKFDNPDVCREIAQGWIDGKPFGVLLGIIEERKVKKIAGSQLREFKIEDVVGLCEGELSFHGAMLIGALCEILEMRWEEDTIELRDHLRLFQKRLKYGLPSKTAVTLYEFCFPDRVICQDLVETLALNAPHKYALRAYLSENRDKVGEVLKEYPAYFSNRLKELLR